MLGSFAGLLLGHTLLGVPYVVLIMSVAIRSFDTRIEQVTYPPSITAIATLLIAVSLALMALAARLVRRARGAAVQQP